MHVGKKLKKTLAILIAIVMMLGMIPFAAMADELNDEDPDEIIEVVDGESEEEDDPTDDDEIPNDDEEEEEEEDDEEEEEENDTDDEEEVFLSISRSFAPIVRSSAQEFTVTWFDGDGNLLDSEPYEEGDMPSYSGATPTKAPQTTPLPPSTYTCILENSESIAA